jgi:hypothetical protein
MTTPRFFFVFAAVSILAGSLFTSCNLEKEVDIDLPDYDNQLVVECYLEPGLPYRLSLSKSAAYFAPFPDPDDVGGFLQELLVQGAEVRIRHKDQVIALENRLSIDLENQRLYNYTGNDLVPLDTLAPFFLEIITPEGKKITGQTRLLPRVPIDSVVVEFKESDTLARTLTYFGDPGEGSNFFRFVLRYSNQDSIPLQDFTLEDRFVDKSFVLGAAYEFSEGDTLVHTLYHVEESYYRFLESVQRAVFGNGNPFAQPSPLISNLGGDAGAVGVFTGLHYDRRVTIIKRK